MLRIEKREAHATKVADERNARTFLTFPRKSTYRNAVFWRTAVDVEREGTRNAEKPGRNSSTVARVTGVAQVLHTCPNWISIPQ